MDQLCPELFQGRIQYLAWLGGNTGPTEDYNISDDTELDFLAHSRSLGRVSAMSMLCYFAVGPYVNLTMLGNASLPSFGFPFLGGGLMVLMVLKPLWFKSLSIVFSGYTVMILYLTA